MIDYKFNDGGRRAAGYKSKTGDCVIRAFCILTGADYKESCELFGVKLLGNVRGIKKHTYKRIFVKMGLKKISLTGTRPTFTEAHSRYGNCLITTRKHITAVIDGALNDIYDWRTYDANFYPNIYVGADDDGIRERKAMTVWVIGNYTGGVKPAFVSELKLK